MAKVPVDPENKTANDVKIIAAYITGVLSFATAVAAFFVKALGFRQDTTIGVVTVLSVLFLLTAYLIHRSEKRSLKEIERVRTESVEKQVAYEKDIQYLKKMALENQRSALRTEMDNEIFRRPENHDTIIKYAYRYFVELDSDWVETEKFQAWIDKENAAGRTVHLPRELLSNVAGKIAAER